MRRRLEVRATTDRAVVYDDFAHHPREIAASLQAVRTAGGGARVVAVFEPRSNTMKMGRHDAALADAFAAADSVLCYRPPEWPGGGALAAHADARVYDSEARMWEALRDDMQTGGHYVVMSNGGFFNFAGRLAALAKEAAA